MIDLRETELDSLIDAEIAPGWMVVRCDENKLWLENQHCYSAFELDSARARDHAQELLRELRA